MTHYCPQCADEAEYDEDIEVHQCSQCRDTYCTHFIKDTQNIEEFHVDDQFGTICWVCGSEKRSPPKYKGG